MTDCKLRAKNCGGCPLLGLDYAAQLKQKEEKVRTLVGKYGPVRPIRGMQQPWHYRNKAIATFAPAPGGKVTTGIYAAGTHKVLPTEDCLLQDAVLNKTLLAVRQAANACRYAPFNEDKGTGLLRHCLVRRGVVTGQVMVVLVTAQPVLPGAKNFIRALLEAAAAREVTVTTVVQNYNPRRTSAVLGTQEKVLYGKGFILDELCGKRYAISPRSFYQVNPVQTAVLYGLAVEAAHLTGKETVLDAYCGIGTIGLTAADRCKQVLGVEVNRDAVQDAIGNVRHNGVRNARFVAADATAWMLDAAQQGLKADVVFMDPPREGSTPQFLQSLARLSPRRVVYVSCNPETLARDLTQLTALGYRVQEITPVDMFPHTEHIETVVLLSHKKADSYIHIDVEFGEGEGKIPVDSIAKRAEAYKPKEKVTYKMIKEYIEAKYGFKVHTAYIAEVKRDLGLPMYDAPNAVEELKQPRKHPTAEKVEAIKDALKHFEVI